MYCPAYGSWQSKADCFGQLLNMVYGIMMRGAFAPGGGGGTGGAAGREMEQGMGRDVRGIRLFRRPHPITSHGKWM